VAGHYMTHLLKRGWPSLGKWFAGQSQNLKKYNFYTASAADHVKAASCVSGESNIVLLSMRSLAAYPFSFPFGRNSNVRNALTMAFRPVLGERENFVSMFPQITEQAQNCTKGVAWFVSKSEIEEFETIFGPEAVLWPAPLIFVHEVDGDGLIIWCDKSGYSAVLFENYMPVFYRWMPEEDGSPENLSELITRYAESVGKTVHKIRIINENDVSYESLQEYGENSLKYVKNLEMLDLSSKGTDNARKTEALLGACFKAARLLTAAGFVFLLFSSVLLIQNYLLKDSFENAPSEIYRIAFKEESRNPVSASKRKLKMITGNGSQMTIEQTLSRIASAWQDKAEAAAVKMDLMRYGTEQTEIEGIADSVSSIEWLRDSLNKKGFSAKIGEVLQVPGSGLRFRMILTGDGK